MKLEHSSAYQKGYCVSQALWKACPVEFHDLLDLHHLLIFRMMISNPLWQPATFCFDLIAFLGLGPFQGSGIFFRFKNFGGSTVPSTFLAIFSILKLDGAISAVFASFLSSNLSCSTEFLLEFA